MSDSDSERDPVDVLAEEFAERCRRGETPSVGEYVERYPQLAEQLRDLLPAVAQMEQMKRRKQSAAANGTDGPGLDRVVAAWREGTVGVQRERMPARKNRSTDSWHAAAPQPATAPAELEPEPLSDAPPAAPGEPPGPSRWRQVARMGVEAADALH